MADDELEINAIGENEEIFDEMKELIECEGGYEDDLESFLDENKLTEHLSLFRDQQIDFETLMILTEPDLKSLGLPLGPYRKLINALKKKKSDLQAEADGMDNSECKEEKIKEEPSDLPTLADEGSFRVIDESGDDSDTHSIKSEHTGDKKKDDSKPTAPDNNHPYKYDLLQFVIPEELKIKLELQEPSTIDTKTFEYITDDRRIKSAIRNLRKEKIIAVEAKSLDNYEKTLTMMQISTQNIDYLFDFSKINQYILLLTDLFTNPNILKVFYDAKYTVKLLQKFYNLFTINAYCVRSAVKELKYETSSLYGLINKYVSYFKPTESDCTMRPIRNDVKLNLRKETHYLLHIYYKTRNEAIEAGVYDNIISVGTRICGYLHLPLTERKPETLFSDYSKFNEAQKLAAEELHKWRETIAKDKNVDPNTIMSVKDLKQVCLSLPIKKDELLTIVDTRNVRIYFLKILAILKTSRKKYFNDPKDETKYDLKAIDSPKPKNKPTPKPSPKPKVPIAKPKPEIKRKSDVFNHPGQASAKKPRFRAKKNFGGQSKRNSFDKGGKAMKSPFRAPGGGGGGGGGGAGGGGYRGGYQGASPKNFQQQNMVKYPNAQNIWEPQQNQGFSNNYNTGFKYY